MARAAAATRFKVLVFIIDEVIGVIEVQKLKKLSKLLKLSKLILNDSGLQHGRLGGDGAIAADHHQALAKEGLATGRWAGHTLWGNHPHTLHRRLTARTMCRSPRSSILKRRNSTSAS